MHALALLSLIGLQCQAPVGIQLLPELFEEVSQGLRADVLTPRCLPRSLVLLQLPVQERSPSYLKNSAEP